MSAAQSANAACSWEAPRVRTASLVLCQFKNRRLHRTIKIFDNAFYYLNTSHVQHIVIHINNNKKRQSTRPWCDNLFSHVFQIQPWVFSLKIKKERKGRKGILIGYVEMCLFYVFSHTTHIQHLNLGPLLWKCGVLTAGLPGESHA